MGDLPGGIPQGSDQTIGELIQSVATTEDRRRQAEHAQRQLADQRSRASPASILRYHSDRSLLSETLNSDGGDSSPRSAHLSEPELASDEGAPSRTPYIFRSKRSSACIDSICIEYIL